MPSFHFTKSKTRASSGALHNLMAGLTWIKADEAGAVMMTVLNRSDSGPIVECGAKILISPRGDAP
jgi:hypothetical protein